MEARELAFITGKIRDQGSNFSHETRRARLLATSQTNKIFLPIFCYVFKLFLPFKNIDFRFCAIQNSLNIRTVSINDKDICK